MSGFHTDDQISSTKMTIIIHIVVAGRLISQEWVIVKLCATKNAKSNQLTKQEVNFAPQTRVIRIGKVLLPMFS